MCKVEGVKSYVIEVLFIVECSYPRIASARINKDNRKELADELSVRQERNVADKELDISNLDGNWSYFCRGVLTDIREYRDDNSLNSQTHKSGTGLSSSMAKSVKVETVLETLKMKPAEEEWLLKIREDWKASKKRSIEKIKSRR